MNLRHQELVGRQLERAALRSLLLPGDGCVLIGEAGSGKSALLADLCSEDLDGWHVVRLTGTSAGSRIPLGVIGGNLPPNLATQSLPVAPLVRDHLDRQRDGRPVLVVVDDAHWLDDTSARMVAQLHHSVPVAYAMSSRSIAQLPEAIADLWTQGRLHRVDLAPLTDCDAAALMTTLVGGPVERATLERVAEIAQGNPLLIRELVAAGHDSNAWVHTPAGFELLELPVQAGRLVDLVERRCQRLTPQQRMLLLAVAIGEPLGLAELPNAEAFVDLSATFRSTDSRTQPGDGTQNRPADVHTIIAQLEGLDLVSTEFAGRRVEVRMAHPLYGEVLRANSSALQLRTVRASLARQLQALGGRRANDPLRLAIWSRGAGVQLGGDLLARATRTAYFAHDWDLACELGEEVWREQPTFDNAEMLADAMYQDGRVPELMAHLPRWQSTSTIPDERIRVELLAAVTNYWLRGDAPNTWAALDRAEQNPPSPWRDEALGVRATLYAFAGRTAEAIAVAQPLLDRDPDRVRVQAAMATTVSLAFAGRSSEALQIAEQAIADYSALGEQVNLFARRMLGVAQGVALITDGRFEEAQDLALTVRCLAEQERDGDSLALITLLLGWIAMHKGPPDLAAEQMRRAETELRAVHHPGMARWALIGQAYLACLAGDLAEAQRHVHAIERADHPARMFECYLAVTLAVLDAQQDTGAAAERLAATQRSMERAGNAFGAQLCANRVASWPQPNQSGQVGSVLSALSLVDRSDSQLDLRRSPDPSELLFGDPPDGWITLTPRERELAELALQRMSAQEIGERLFISRRTVESHLAKIYQKVGVTSRRELIASAEQAAGAASTAAPPATRP